MERRYLPRSGTMVATRLGTSYTVARSEVLICPSGKRGALSDAFGTPRLEFQNANATFRNGYAGIINTLSGSRRPTPGYRLHAGTAILQLRTERFRPVRRQPFANDNSVPSARRLSAASYPADTWLAADNSFPDIGIREVVFPHLNFTRNYAYLDGHAETLRVNQVDGALWFGYHIVWDARKRT